MNNFTPLKIKNKKNFKKILIFGNLILVVLVAVIGIVYYNRTLQTTQQKAVAPGACVCNDSRGNAVGGSCSGGSCDCGNLEVRNDRCGETSGGGQPDQQNNEQSCDNSGGHWCDVWDTSGQKHSFCAGRTEGCQNAAVEQGITMQTGGGGPGLGGWRCIYGQNGYSGGPCVESNSTQTIGAGRPPNCFCGVIQIDGGEWNGTYQSTCGCNQEQEAAITTSTPVGTIVPVPSDVPTPTEILISQLSPTVVPTDVPPTEVPTEVPTTKPTDKPGPTATPIPVLCGTKDCDDKTNPCRSGYLCVQAKDGSNYCTSPDFANACKANPSYNSCCTAPGSATATPTATTAPVPVSGRSPWWIFVFPTLIILGSLIL
ncbi:hypothetical protein HZA76_01860 [Candidatus Roizmanbacteria bacterium]|nr:hypothetical protein [Candidatus Roizmanbacteria bacterium]